MPKESVQQDGNVLQVQFGFLLDERVKTPFGDMGLITMLGYDEGGQTYYVKTATASNWFKEDQLHKI